MTLTLKLNWVQLITKILIDSSIFIMDSTKLTASTV